MAGGASLPARPDIDGKLCQLCHICARGDVGDTAREGHGPPAAGRNQDGGLQARRAWARHREPRAHPPRLTQPFGLSHARTRTRLPSRTSIAPDARQPSCAGESAPSHRARLLPPRIAAWNVPRSLTYLAAWSGHASPLSARTKSGGGESSPPPPRAVTPWCRPSCARPVCVCASDARSGRRRRRSCSLCGSRSCPGPRCGRCRRIRA